MPLNHNLTNGLTEVRSKAGDLLMLLPTQIFVDLRRVAHLEGIDRANDDRYLLGELGYAGRYLEQRDVDSGEVISCWNCGGTEGFMAPTGARNRSLFHVRTDGRDSRIKCSMVTYPCPACQNPKQKLLEDLRRAGIADPDGALVKVIRAMPGRGEMEAGIRELIERIRNDTYAGQVTLVGPFGCGKSTLSQYVVVEAKRAHRDAIYVTAERFKEAVGEQFRNEQDGGGSSYLQRIKSAPIVIMDQIDWIRETTSGGQQSYTAEVLRDVFNHRYELRRTHCTVYVVNVAAWMKHGDNTLAAIYDRMNDGIVLTAKTKDARRTLQGESAAD